MNRKILIYLCFSFYATAYAKYVKIIGGEDADITEFPYSVSLRWMEKNNHFCGGAILSEWYVITAAHCIVSLQKTTDVAAVYVGNTKISIKTGSIHKIQRSYVHPEYTGHIHKQSMYEHDIGIIMVKYPIIFDKFRKSIELTDEDFNGKGTGILTGWGLISFPDYARTNNMQKVSMNIMDNSRCLPMVPFVVKPTQMCVYQGKGIGACWGDSGSPLVSNGKLIAIASFVFPCAADKPDIYSNVYFYRDFIKSITNI